MDVATIILGIALINVAVFLAGCSLAAVRTWRERTAARDQPSGPISDRRPTAEPRLQNADRRAH